MGSFHVAYNGYVWKTLFLYRHPERSRGIFLAHWYNAICATAEKGKPFAKGARKNKVQGRFLAVLEMTVGGEWVYFTQRTTDMFGKRHFRNVIPSEAEGSFWHTGIASYVRQRKRGNLLRKEQERAECEEYFSTLLEMTVWGNGVISRSVQRICLENAISVMSSRAKSRDLSGTPV